jgi:hypothetical protein
MNWACKLTADAERDLRGLPKAIQKRVARVLTQMADDPFQGVRRPYSPADWQDIPVITSLPYTSPYADSAPCLIVRRRRKPI